MQFRLPPWVGMRSSWWTDWKDGFIYSGTMILIRLPGMAHTGRADTTWLGSC
jgi:hypothetical protein